MPHMHCIALDYLKSNILFNKLIFETSVYTVTGCSYKRDLILEKQIPHKIVFFSKFPFYETQIINLILSLMISANHDKDEEYLPLAKSYCSLLFLYCRISFVPTINEKTYGGPFYSPMSATFK